MTGSAFDPKSATFQSADFNVLYEDNKKPQAFFFLTWLILSGDKYVKPLVL